MDKNIFKSLLEGAAHQNWRTALLLFALTAIVRFAAVPYDTTAPIALAMALYVLITLICVKKQYWREIRLQKPTNLVYILKGVLLISAWFLGTWIFLYLIFGFSPSNWFVGTARPILIFGVVTKENAWQYFIPTVLGACLISPIAEELFFRSPLLKSFEHRFSAFSANLLQAFLFGFIHLTHFGLNPLDLALIVTMISTIMVACMIYGWVVQKTGSVFSGTIIHAFNNFIIYLFLFAFIIPAIG